MAFRCNARTKQCRKCGHRYPKAEYDLLECPDCGESRPCLQRVSREGQRCHYHGGKSLRGVASPAFKTGRWSTSLPDQLIAKYEEAKADAELMELRAEIALTDTRISDLLGRVDSGESGQIYRSLRGVFRRFVQARSGEDVRGMAACLEEMDRLIRRGQGDYACWNNVFRLVEQRRKLVESEWKRLVQLDQVMTYERAMVLLGMVYGAIRRHVRDRKVLDAIASDIREAMGDGAGGSALVGSKGAELASAARDRAG